MTDTPDTAAQPQQPTGPSLRVLNQYIKDLSFENPGVRLNEQPNVDLGIDVQATAKDAKEGMYEVVLKLNARAGTKDAALFLVELEYGGLFQVQGASQADAEAMLLIECPRLLFPFARRIVSDLTQEGGFPPLRIDPVDFTALYRQQKERAQENGQNGAAIQTSTMPSTPAAEPENGGSES